MRRFADEHEIDLGASYAYSDSASDLPMLRAVGNAVVVNPDQPLAEIAQAEGWRVMRFERLGRKLAIAAATAVAAAIGTYGAASGALAPGAARPRAASPGDASTAEHRRRASPALDLPDGRGARSAPRATSGCGSSTRAWTSARRSSRRSPAQPVRPLYTEDDRAGADPERDLGFPGEFPYTRGVYPSMYRGRLWTMRQFAGFGTAEETNERFHYLLDHGQTGLSTAFDMPTLMGLDSDHARSLGEVGVEGVAIDTLDDMETLFAGIPLGRGDRPR